MVKLDYFGMLEEIAAISANAVRLVCNERVDKEALATLRVETDKKLCILEDALFLEFIPPLQRDNIAAYAHCLSRVVDKAAEYYSEMCVLGRSCPTRPKNDEAKICVELAEKLLRSTALLRGIKSSEATPEIVDFRETLKRGREAHSELLSRLSSGGYPKVCGQIIIITARLRLELSRCFDELVEIMLNNI